MSTAPEDLSGGSRLNGGAGPVAPKRAAAFYRRTLSLEQQAGDAMSSQESLDSLASEASRYGERPRATQRSRTVDRDVSVDRLSTDSSTSDVKKKRGLMGKLKQLTRSRSIEDSGVADLIVNAGIKASACTQFVQSL